MDERTEPPCPVVSLARQFEELARQHSVSEERDLDLRMSEIAEAALPLTKDHGRRGISDHVRLCRS
jgi:predicted protein tyrosine phosphatase